MILEWEVTEGKTKQTYYKIWNRIFHLQGCSNLEQVLQKHKELERISSSKNEIKQWDCQVIISEEYSEPCQRSKMEPVLSYNFCYMVEYGKFQDCNDGKRIM